MLKDSMLYPARRYNLNLDVCSVLLCLFILILFLIGMMVSSCGKLAVDIIRNGRVVPVQKAEPAVFVFHVAHNSISYLLIFYFMTFAGTLTWIEQEEAGMAEYTGDHWAESAWL